MIVAAVFVGLGLAAALGIQPGVGFPLDPSLGAEYFPDRREVASVLDLDRPWKVHLTFTEADRYFGTVPKRCDITRHLGRGVFNGEAKYWYRTKGYIIYPTIEVREYSSSKRAASTFRDVRTRFRACKNRKWVEPFTPGGGGEITWTPYRVPKVGNASFGFVSLFNGEGGSSKSRILLSRVGDTIVYVQGMNYGGATLPTPSAKPYGKLARLAVRKAQ